MAMKTVLKVDVWCQKGQKKLLQAVCELQGVDKIEVDAAKGLLTVTGEADPCEIVVRARKACKHAEVVNIGPPPAPQKDQGKKPDQNKAQAQAQAHSSDNCPICQGIAVVHWEQWDEPRFMCSIL